MAMTDPLADFLTRIRNGQAALKVDVEMPSSKLKVAAATVLRDEGYIEDFQVEARDKKPVLRVKLKYYKGAPVISKLERVSKPGCRVYRDAKNLPRVLGGLGVAVVSTSKGVTSDRVAAAAGHGGEVLFIVS